MKKVWFCIMSVVALTLPLSGCHQTETKQEVKVVDGWVVNVNIFDGQTEFAFETEGNPTPWSGEIAGRIPELYQGEHVHIRLYRDSDSYYWRFDTEQFKRLTNDRH